MNLIAWLVLGAIAGYLAGLFVRGDEGLGIIGHIVLGIVGAFVGGFLASALFGVRDPIQGALDISTRESRWVEARARAWWTALQVASKSPVEVSIWDLPTHAFL